MPLFCSYQILTSSAIYYWTDARQHGIYLLNRNTILNQSAPIFSLGYFLTCIKQPLLGCVNTSLYDPLHGLSIKITYHYIACSCRRYNARSDWLTVGHYSPVMPTDRLRVCKNKAKSRIMNNVLTSNVRYLRKNLKPCPCRIDLAIARSLRWGLGLRFSRKELIPG